MPIDPATIRAQLKDRSRRIIHTDGRIEPVFGPQTISQIEEHLKTATLDTVNLRHMGPPMMIMAVDDFGWETITLRGNEVSEEMKTIARERGMPIETLQEQRAVRPRKPINEIATALYRANCVPGTTHQIVGDVYVCPDEDFAG